MPWREVSTVDQRREFVALASVEGVNRRDLCRRFGISAQTGYKWLLRACEKDADLNDRSRRPHSSPLQCSEVIEALVLEVRDTHPAWGARKIERCLARDGHGPPAISTKVGNQSSAANSSFLTVPGLMCPGQRTTHGAR